jgi:hypothetical protein
MGEPDLGMPCSKDARKKEWESYNLAHDLLMANIPDTKGHPTCDKLS